MKRQEYEEARELLLLEAKLVRLRIEAENLKLRKAEESNARQTNRLVMLADVAYQLSQTRLLSQRSLFSTSRVGIGFGWYWQSYWVCRDNRGRRFGQNDICGVLLARVSRLLRTLRHCVAETETLSMLSIFYKDTGRLNISDGLNVWSFRYNGGNFEIIK